MAQLTRRSLLTLGGVAGLLSLAGPAAAAAPARATVRRFTPPGLIIGPRSDFTRYVGRTVTATNASGSHRLRLTEIADVSHAAVGDAQSYNLLFTPPAGASFQEGLYRLTALGLRSTTMLLTVVGPAGPAQRIQALVNRTR